MCACVRVPEIDEKQKDDNFKMKAFLLLFSDSPSRTCLEVKIFLLFLKKIKWQSD